MSGAPAAPIRRRRRSLTPRPFLPPRWLLPLLLATALAPLSGFGQGAGEVEIESTRIERDAQTGGHRYEDAHLRTGKLTLDAQLIEFNPDTNKVVASGQVRFRQGAMIGSARRAEFDLNDDSATLFNARLYDATNGYHLYAERVISPSLGRFIAYECSLTACSPSRGGWRVEAEELDYRVDDFATSSHAVLKLGDAPAFWFPFFAWPTVDQRRSGFLAPTFAFESSSAERLDLGARITVPYFWAPAISHDLTVVPEVIQNRGIALNLQYNYAFWENQVGALRLFAIPELQARDASRENIPSGVTPESGFKPFRHFLEWRHNQGFADQGRLIFSGVQAGDGQILREYFRITDFRPHEEYQLTYSAQSWWGAYAATAARNSGYFEESVYADSSGFADGRYRPRLLPRAAFVTGATPLPHLPLAISLSGQVARFTSEQAVAGTLTEARPTLSYPFRLGGSWELLPSVTRRFVQFQGVAQNVSDADPEDVPTQAFQQNDLTVELKATFARVYPGGANGALKHRLTPRLIYREVADAVQPLAGSYNLREVTRANSGAAEDLRAGVLPPHYAQRIVTLRFDNQWVARTPPGSRTPAREVMYFNFIQRYNLLVQDEDVVLRGPSPDLNQLETELGEPLLPAILEGGVAGANLSFGYRLRYHYQLKEITQTQLTVKGAIRNRGHLRIAYNQTDYSFRTPENRLIAAASSLEADSEVAISDEVSLGMLAVVNLANSPAALGRRLESGEVFAQYTPGCYTVRASLVENLSFSRVNNQVEYFVDRRIVFTFDLGGLVQGTSTQILSGGD